MERSSFPYIFAFTIVILFKIIFVYMVYKKDVRRYAKKFRKTLIKHGIPKNVANDLSRELRVIGLKDFFNVISYEKLPLRLSKVKY